MIEIGVKCYILDYSQPSPLLGKFLNHCVAYDSSVANERVVIAG